MALGWPSVEWGLAHISSQELSEWLAYEQVEGFVGDFRMDFHFARLMALFLNYMRGKDGSPVTPKDLMIWYEPEDEEEHITDDDELFDLMWQQVHGNEE